MYVFSPFFFVEEEKKQVQKHLTDPAALSIVYESEVCVDDYANPRSAYKLLRYIPFARSFLLCRQVKDFATAKANPANASDPPHDIREMAGINIKKLLPPSCTQAEASDPILPGERKRKRKGPSKGEASRPEVQVTPDVVQLTSTTVGVDTVPSVEETDTEMVGPFVPDQGAGSSAERAPVWAPSLRVFGELVRSDATVLRTGGSESNTATALSEVARLPMDMAVWKQSTNQEVFNNLRRGLMMVSLGMQTPFLLSLFLFFFFIRSKKFSTQTVQGSLELDDRFQRTSAELENSLKVTTRTFDFRNEAERLRRDVEAYKDQVRITVLKKDKIALKLEETEDLLRKTLEANSEVDKKFKALEADVAAKEKIAFDRGQTEAQRIMSNQLPSIYNEAFQEGWKALYAWPESDDMPRLPPQENLPYLEAPIGVPEEELAEPQPLSNEEAGPSTA